MLKMGKKAQNGKSGILKKLAADSGHSVQSDHYPPQARRESVIRDRTIPGEIRTHNLWLRRPTRYPIALRGPNSISLIR